MVRATGRRMMLISEGNGGARTLAASAPPSTPATFEPRRVGGGDQLSTFSFRRSVVTAPPSSTHVN
jgi:hypothetical protein